MQIAFKGLIIIAAIAALLFLFSHPPSKYTLPQSTIEYSDAFNDIQSNCSPVMSFTTTNDYMTYILPFYRVLFAGTPNATLTIFPALSANTFLFSQTISPKMNTDTSTNQKCWALVMIDATGTGTVVYQRPDQTFNKISVTGYPVATIVSGDAERVVYWPTGQNLVVNDCQNGPSALLPENQQQMETHLYGQLSNVQFVNGQWVAPVGMFIKSDYISNSATGSQCLVAWVGDASGHGTVVYMSKNGGYKTISVSNYPAPSLKTP